LYLLIYHYDSINIKTDANALKQVPKFKYLGSIFTEDGKNKEDIIPQIKEAIVMFSNKKAPTLFK
jgi:hypothetical protein